MDALDVSQEPNELDREVDLGAGFDALRTVGDGHGLRVRQVLSAEACRRSYESLSKLVCGRAGNTGSDRETGQSAGPSRPDDRRASRGNIGGLDMMVEDSLIGRANSLSYFINQKAFGHRIED